MTLPNYVYLRTIDWYGTASLRKIKSQQRSILFYFFFNFLPAVDINWSEIIVLSRNGLTKRVVLWWNVVKRHAYRTFLYPMMLDAPIEMTHLVRRREQRARDEVYCFMIRLRQVYETNYNYSINSTQEILWQLKFKPNYMGCYYSIYFSRKNSSWIRWQWNFSGLHTTKDNFVP